VKQQALLLVASFSLACFAASAQAQPAAGTLNIKGTAPGKAVAARTSKIVATVEAVDVQKRQIDLKGPKGNVVTLAVGPEVRNLAQVKVGDQVSVAYVEALSLELKKDGKELRSRTDTSGAARAPAGDKPAGVVAEQVKVVADVAGVDTKTQIVTLRGPKRTVELYVADPEQVKLIKIGDQVEATYTQALAVAVEPVPAKK
jgi:Cu/Ag efflux protein CusF